MSVQTVSPKSWTRVTCRFLIIKKKKSQQFSSSKSLGGSKWLGQPVFARTELVLVKGFGTCLAWCYDWNYCTGAGNLSLPRRSVPLCLCSTWSTSTGALDLCDLCSCSVTNLLPVLQKGNPGKWQQVQDYQAECSSKGRGKNYMAEEVQEKKVSLINV